jgi:hypothetical protein
MSPSLETMRLLAERVIPELSPAGRAAPSEGETHR